jgi:hypothetical protein
LRLAWCETPRRHTKGADGISGDALVWSSLVIALNVIAQVEGLLLIHLEFELIHLKLELLG